MKPETKPPADDRSSLPRSFVVHAVPVHDALLAISAELVQLAGQMPVVRDIDFELHIDSASGALLCALPGLPMTIIPPVRTSRLTLGRPASL